jgi:two-component system, OmpR family, manganese sensing sensor histidine kinase
MFQATQRRLALWYTAITAVLLLVFASGFFLYVRSTLIERVDDTLNHVVEVVQRSLVLETNLFETSPTASPPELPTRRQQTSPKTNQTRNFATSQTSRINLEASFRRNPDTSAAVEDDRIDLELFSPQGELLWSSWPAPLDLPFHPGNHGETVQPEPEHWLRQITEPLQANGQLVGWLRVSHPWFEVTKPTQQLMVDLLAGTSLMVLLVAASGWFLSRLAIAPIRESYQYLKQFTADASHELRNPIALIQTNVQVALSDPNINPQEQRQQLEVVERLTRRLGRLVDDLLFLARQDSGMVQPQTQPCPLDALLMEVLEEQRTIAQAKQVSLNLDIADVIASNPNEEPFTIKGDYDQLVRLFTNLVSNGIQYTPTGGKVKVVLKTSHKQALHYVQVDIHDSGGGIPEAALAHLFERFYRVDPARAKPADTPPSTTGTGLGLAIAQAIVQNHHGMIRVESVLEQGSTFTVLLPQ